MTTPQITELTNADELENGAGATTDLAETAGTADEKQSRGPLLDLPDKDAARRVVAMRKLRHKTRSRRAAEALRVIYWRKGFRFVTLTGNEDTGNWKAVLPMGASKQPPNPNKVDRLIRRIVSVVTNDPPVPNAIPERDDDKAISAAELSTRILKVEGASTALNLARTLRRMMDKSATFRSSFAFFYVDTQGGGHRPLSMLAHPDATNIDNAEVDPATGAPADDSTAKERFVMADGTLTDNIMQADRQWLPKIKVRLLTPQHVDLLPETADSIDEAIGVTIQLYSTLGELKAQHPDFFKTAQPADVRAIVEYKPEEWKSYLPREMRGEWTAPKQTPDGGYDDDAIVFPTLTYYKQHAEYPEGAYVVTIGALFRLHAEVWARPVQLADGTEKMEYLELPVAQCRNLDDDVDDDQMGIAIGEKLGPMDEIRATILGYALNYLFRFGNPQPYLPIGTTIQPKQLTYRTGDPIYVPPGAQPYYENVPEFPHKISELGMEMSRELDDESDLQQAAQGVEDSSVQSGIHAQTIVEQSNIALSQIKENAGDCYKRMCRVVLQLWRVFYDVEQQVDYEGEDGAWKRAEWIGTDLGSTKLVEIARGSFTMQAPTAKQAQATQWFQAGVIKPDEYEQIIATGIGPTLGVEDNPERKRVMGQLAQWREGPTEADTEAATQYQEAQQQQQQAQAQQQQEMAAQSQSVAHATGAPQPVPNVQAAPLAPLVLPGDPFAADQRACDQEQDSAMIRHRAIKRIMATKAFGNQPQFWKDALVAEYERMRSAAGVMTVAEQSQMAMQAAQMKLWVAQTPKVQVIDKSATAATIGPDVAAAQAAYHGGAQPGAQPAPPQQQPA